MLENKRKFERFSLPLPVSFRPTYGSMKYTDGDVINISCDGLALESKDFAFIRYENLELQLAFPQSSESLSVTGNVIWKKNTGDECTAGVKFKKMNEGVRNRLIESISSFGNIPVDRFNTAGETGTEIKEENDELPVLNSSKKKRKSARKTRKQGFTKQYCHGGTRCKVTFRLPAEAAADARKITIVGDFNAWNTVNTPMKQVKHGDYLVTLELESNREYRFRYLIDGNRWENDWSADKYLPNEFGADDSVVVV